MLLVANPFASTIQCPAVTTISGAISVPEHPPNLLLPLSILIGTTKLLPVASSPFSIAWAGEFRQLKSSRAESKMSSFFIV
jgi:hypothetical protein